MNRCVALLSSALSISILGSSVCVQAHSPDLGEKLDKCAGIVKAGRNDCGTNAHSCAGQASTDAAPSDWIALPKGVCERIVGGKVVRSLKKGRGNKR